MSAVQDDDIEDYDYLKLDPDTLIHGSRGGAGTTTSDDSRPSQDSISTSSRRISFDSRMSDTSSTINIHESARIRRQSEPDSIPPKLNNENIIRRTPFLGNNAIRLESTEEEGRYILTADDDEVREILRLGAEREKIEQNPSRHRSRIRDLVFTRQFTTFDRQNPLSSESPFHGFFTLFWLAMVLIFVKVSANNWRQYGSILGSNEVVHYMFARDIVVLGVTDLAMLISTASGLLLQKVILKGYLTWARSGWIIQNIWQTIFLASLIGWTFYREWPWTHTIFMVLHALVYLMKQHSYAFYNGHLSTMYRRRTMLKRKLAQLRAKGSSNVVVNGTSSAIMSPQSELMDSLTSPALRPRAVDGARIPSELTQGDTSDIKRVTKAIEDGKPFTRDQVDAFERLIESQIKALDQELQGKCEAVKNSYPNNLTWRNFVDWTCLPTLVYELEYPRLDYINWWYVAEKTAATFGVLAVMMVVSQAFIYPSVAKTVRMKEASVSLEQRWVELPWLISDILFPLLLEQLLSWYVIWVSTIVHKYLIVTDVNSSIGMRVECFGRGYPFC